MIKPRLRVQVLAVLTFLCWAFPCQPALAGTPAKYVILLQGDGMGFEHVKAGGMYGHGAANTLCFESFPNQTSMTHNNASGATTDSAASATAMATGAKVDNGVVSVRLPGDGADLTSLLEQHREFGRAAGLVTESFLTDASPACHGAHEPSRSNTAEIFGDYLNRSRPEILLGGGGNGYDGLQAQAQGYTVVLDRAGLLALDTETAGRVAGGFGGGLIPPEGAAGRDPSLPTLPEMTQQALAVLDNNSAGFYVFIEQEGIDEYAHANDGLGLCLSVQELDHAVQAAIAWVDAPTTDADWTNTLLIVLADHETGGLTVTETSPQAGIVPSMAWSTTGHTQTPVPVYARGAGAEQITGTQIDNTGIFTFLRPLSAPVAVSETPSATSTPDLQGNRVAAFPIPGREYIRFILRLDQSAVVRITLYNPAGERVAELAETLPAGPGQMTWDCSGAAPGLYLARVLADSGELGTLKVCVAR